MAGKDFEPVYANERPGDIKHSLADISLARKKLGYQPEYSLDEGLKLTMDYYQLKVKKQSPKPAFDIEVSMIEKEFLYNGSLACLISLFNIPLL